VDLGFRPVGLDLSIGLLHHARQRVGGNLVNGDMRGLPFARATFDGVWLAAALLHIPREQAPLVLNGVRRILGLGSILFLAVKQGEGWEPPSAKSGSLPKRKGQFTICSAGVLFVLSGVYELFSITSEKLSFVTSITIGHLGISRILV